MCGKPSLLLALLLAPVLTLGAETRYVQTPRDTGTNPGPVTQQQTIDPEYELLAETDTLRLHYRADRAVFLVEDRRNGYLWKTGLDIPFNRDIEDLADDGVDPAELPPLEERLNTTFTGIANSLLYVEYFDVANNIKGTGSSAREDVRTTMTVRSESPFRAEVRAEFQRLDFTVKVQLELDGDALVVRLDNADIWGDGAARLGSVGFAPFMGASGGRQIWWSDEEEDFEISRPKYSPPGYVVVPDGSGALIRFADNSSKLSAYTGDIYGEDLSQSGLFRSFDDFSVPHKNAYMPLYGVVHGNRQNAIAAYANEGAEYMEVVVTPEENQTFYTWAYPRFVYNRLYYQVYNNKGDGYFRLLEEPNRLNVEFRYQFLAGAGEDGGYPADYAGIALAYRDHLKSSGQLAIRPQTDAQDIPLRLDFLMADVRESIVGYTHEVTTTISQVDDIVTDLQAAGIPEISVGLLGYARGGTVLSRPGSVRLLRRLGSEMEFADVIGDLVARGVDVSFARDYARIGDGQVTPWGNAIRGASGWYNERRTFQANAPVNLFYYSKPGRAREWLSDEADQMSRLGVTSHSIDGIGNLLFSDYATGGTTTVEDTRDIYSGALSAEREDRQINVYGPNQYLWAHTDRFLHAPLFPTQFLIETDSVPLLQMVVQGSMDMFGPYSNFSFYSDGDVLRMIDYNVYPSFLLTNESAHLLLMTNSAYFYSTEYAIYRELILDVYGRVNAALRHVINAGWTGRKVVAAGVVLNTYDNGVEIVINYTESPHPYRGEAVPAMSAMVFGPERGSRQ